MVGLGGGGGLLFFPLALALQDKWCKKLFECEQGWFPPSGGQPK
jgi:hypothetical protein